MSKLGTDQFQSYRDAGLKKNTKDESTAICLQPPIRDIKTPQQIQHYRKSFKQQYGVTIVPLEQSTQKHYGTAKDSLPYEHHTYGVVTQKSERAGIILKAGQKIGVGNYVNDILESKYHSLKSQPLAQTISRNYQMPVEAQKDSFKYGLPTEKNQYDAKETIYSAENMPEGEAVRQMYLKSHLDYDPGEQKKRPYNWQVDPSDFRFGKVQKNVIHGEMKQVMAPEANSDNFPQTKFVKANQNDFVNRKEDKLGKSANLGQKQFEADHAFGVRIEPNQWNAGKCLKGQATEFQVREDLELGKATKPGFRNTAKEGDETRIFGVPTIRYDIAKPAQQSMADPNNYADETTAVQLLFPQPDVLNGVDQSDFEKVRSKPEIRQIFENIGFQFRGNIFDAIFERSKAIHGTILDKVSCSSFKKAIYQLTGK